MVPCPTTRVGVSVRCSIAGAAGACGVPRTAKLAKRAFVGGVLGKDVELAATPGFHHRHGYVCAAQGSESERGSPATTPLEEEPLIARQTATSNGVEPAGGIDWVMTALCFVFPALGGAMFGYDIGATSGALLSIMSSETSGTDWYNLTAFQEGLVVSLSLAGALFGSLAALLGGDRIGRRKELMLAAIIYGVAALVTSTSPTLEGLLLGRSLYGLGIGLAMHAAPAYVAETAPPKVRGLLISLKEAFIVGGILLGYLVSYLCIEQVGGWRLMYGVPVVPAAALLAGMAWLPPSPRWLVLSGAGSERAGAALRRVRGRAYGDEDAIALEVRAMEDSVGEQGKENSSDLMLLLSPEYRRPLLIGVLLMLFQQVSGQPSVVYYAASIFRDAGLTSDASATGGSVALGVFKLLMTVLAVSTVDTWGRRPLLLGGVSGIVVALLVLSSTSALGAGSTLSIWAALVALMLYVGCYQVSFGPISWLLVGEVFPLVVRGQAIALATFTNFGSNFAVSLLFPVLRENVGPSVTYLMFAGVGAVALAYIYTGVPETKGKSLEEIEALWKS